jgi:outer membrane immunogenic protein
MRRAALAISALLLSEPALAADYDVLRGSSGWIKASPAYFRWDGFYVGGQVGSASLGADFTGNSSNLISNMLNNTRLQAEAAPSTWITSGKPDSAIALSYGAFAGYNSQWDDAIVGVEFNYNHSNLSVSTSGSVARIVTLSDQFQYAVTVQSASKFTINDYATLRGRAGYALGNFMPYLTGGVALGIASTRTTASVSYPTPVYTGTATPAPPTPPPVSLSATDGRDNMFVYGFALGGGVDWMIFQNVFLRGEYEYLRFSQSKAAINNVRAGLGVRF